MAYIEQTLITPSLANASAFGTLETAELTPVLQGDFVYGLNTQIWNTAVVSGTGATVDTNSSRLRIQSGTNSAGYAYLTSRKIIRYRAGQGTTVRFTPVFTAGVVNNIQLWGIGTISSNLPYDGYFYGFNGTAFGIAHYIAGTPTWIPQSTWNVDKVDGSAGTSFNWNPAKGTPVQIKYPFLGYGDILYQVQNPSTMQWVTVHIEQYANTVTTTELSNPNLQFMGFTLNSGNTTNQTMYLGSIGIFVSGIKNLISNPHWGADNNKGSISATETCLMNIRNCTTYNGVTNKGIIRLNSISLGSGSSAWATLRLKINATFATTPVYTPVNGSTADNGVTLTSASSIASVDTAGTTVTAATGNYIFNISVGANGGNSENIESLGLYVAPGEVLTISAIAQSASSLTASINWSEDI